MIRVITRHVTRHEPGARSLRHRYWGEAGPTDDGPVDFVFAEGGQSVTPEDVFPLLRWGGQFGFISRDGREVEELCRRLRLHGGYLVEQGPNTLPAGLWGVRHLGLGAKRYYLVARKVLLVPPGTYTDRFTFNVRLVRDPGQPTGYAVLKQVPSYQMMAQRLKQRFPKASADLVYDRTHKLVDHVLPVFLSREAAFLSLLQQHLPGELRGRVPQPLGAERGGGGMVSKLKMQWMRLGGRPLTQLEFARQSAELLRALHEDVKLIHLDLRLDNVVITPGGIGFIDFGSSVRMGEDFSASPMLRSLFDEMMSTCQVQRVMGEMTRTGRATSSLFVAAHQKVDRAADLFCLAVQMNNPQKHPDFAGLIDYDPDSEAAKKIELLTKSILRPKDPKRPRYISARDLLGGIVRIERTLNGKTPKRRRM